MKTEGAKYETTESTEDSWEKAECHNTFLIRYSVLSKIKKT
jgi:hypothetical protein